MKYRDLTTAERFAPLSEIYLPPHTIPSLGVIPSEKQSAFMAQLGISPSKLGPASTILSGVLNPHFVRECEELMAALRYFMDQAGLSWPESTSVVPGIPAAVDLPLDHPALQARCPNLCKRVKALGRVNGRS